ncbi:hypothetical protein JNUCC0626_38920 [Lentzea sp. JNUCC 0626]|uniref:hypothetical protein n=1 Tax=Lentzea sp. JNUCC 0626 TaxID=3367513 RepID=UPI0037479568
MTKTWAQLQSLSREELIAEHDRVAAHTTTGLGLLRDELMHHALLESTEAALKEARAARRMTNASVGLAVVAAAIALIALIGDFSREADPVLITVTTPAPATATISSVAPSSAPTPSG